MPDNDRDDARNLTEYASRELFKKKPLNWQVFDIRRAATERKEDLLDVVVPYFKAGLEHNEFCLWAVLYPLTVDEAKSALKLAMNAVDQHIAAGDIEIIRYSEWYLKDGSFDVERVIAASRKKLAQAMANGYAGVRLAANETSPLSTDWKEFSQYERKLDQLIDGQPILVLCSYPIAAATAAHAFEIARIHQFAMAKRDEKWELVKSVDRAG